MNTPTFRQWLIGLPVRQWLTGISGGALKGAKELRNTIVGVGVGQTVGGALVAVLPSCLLWGLMTPYWLAPVIFAPSGVFLVLRGIWNCEKEDKADRDKANT